MSAHRQLVENAHKGRIDLYFLGDSITRRWGATDYPEFLANWNQNFHGWNAAVFGVGGDTTQNMLWRIENGELDGVNPKVIVVLAGTNDVGRTPHPDVAEEVPKRIKAIIDLCRAKAPGATIILTAIFPRNDTTEANPVIGRINAKIATFADGKTVRFLDINNQLADKNGQLHDGMTMDRLHLTAKGYQIWADALKPMLTEMLGPPHTTDCAPISTGEPSAAK
jgi:lysophospholipase L1-like esterase